MKDKRAGSQHTRETHTNTHTYAQQTNKLNTNICQHYGALKLCPHTTLPLTPYPTPFHPTASLEAPTRPKTNNNQQRWKKGPVCHTVNRTSLLSAGPNSTYHANHRSRVDGEIDAAEEGAVPVLLRQTLNRQPAAAQSRPRRDNDAPACMQWRRAEHRWWEHGYGGCVNLSGGMGGG